MRKILFYYIHRKNLSNTTGGNDIFFIDFPVCFIYRQRKGDLKMTDEKISENNMQTSVINEVQTVTERPVSPRREEIPFRKKKGQGNIFSSLIGFAFGFLFSGAKFPLNTYPLGCALVAALPKNTVAAMLGILARTGYLYLNGEDLLLPIVCSTSLMVCRVVLNIILFGKNNLAKAGCLQDKLSMKMLLCAVFVLGTSLVDVVYAGAVPYVILRAALSAVVSVAFALLFSFFFDEEYRYHPVFEAGFGAFCLAATLGSASFAIGEFSVGLAVAFAITLYAGFIV